MWKCHIKATHLPPARCPWGLPWRTDPGARPQPALARILSGGCLTDQASWQRGVRLEAFLVRCLSCNLEICLLHSSQEWH